MYMIDTEKAHRLKTPLRHRPALAQYASGAHLNIYKNTKRAALARKVRIPAPFDPIRTISTGGGALQGREWRAMGGERAFVANREVRWLRSSAWPRRMRRRALF